MLNGKKIVVVMPSYNAAKTLAKTVADIPRDIVDEILLVDDGNSAVSLPETPLLAVLLGLVPMLLAAPLVGAATAAVTGGPVPQLDLALWHEVNLALILSLIAVAGGVILLWQHKRLLGLSLKAIVRRLVG